MNSEQRCANVEMSFLHQQSAWVKCQMLTSDDNDVINDDDNDEVLKSGKELLIHFRLVI